MKIPLHWKKKQWYRELWYFYHVLLYRHLLQYPGYLYGRFWLKKKMRCKAKPIDSPAEDANYSIHLLCCHRDLDMLLWSLASWYRVVPDSGLVYIHEDGSFTGEDRAVIARLLPHAKVVDFTQATSLAHNEWLRDMPHVRALRKEYAPHILIVKLIDPRFVSSAPTRLILDTDMLWFGRPVEILDRLQKGEIPFMQYGGPANPYYFLDGSSLTSSLGELNSGIVGYKVTDYPLSLLEAYCAKVDPTRGPHFIEQSGYAWILSQAKKGVLSLDRDAYSVMGSVKEGVVLRHFTGPRREDFWREGVMLLKNKLLV